MGHDELKERAKAVWGTGDYAPTGRQLEPASQALVDALEIAPGQRVLDVAAGHGNCAIAAARRGAAVVASDFSPAMIETGRTRTQAENLDVEWHEADAADLPFDEGVFDRVTSVFGAIFAPEQEAAASEAVRVTRQGGTIGFTAWSARGFTASLIGVMRRYGPPGAADAPDPLRWGRPDEVRALFQAAGCPVDIRQRVLTLRYASWQDWKETVQAHGMAVVAKQNMPAETYDEMFAEIRALVEAHRSPVDTAIVVDSDYLEIVGTKP